MKAGLLVVLFAFCLSALASCARDVYPKYLRMKQEAIWLEKTCLEGLAKETEYTYKGTGAYIKIRCSKPLAMRPWMENLEMQLTNVGWQLKKREPDGDTYCLRNERIHLIVVPADDENLRTIGLRYPAGLCEAN